MFSIFVAAYLLQAAYVDLYNEGHRLLEENRVREAEVVLKKSASLKPEYTPALKDLAESYVRQKRVADAVDEYKKVVSISPKDMPARARLAELYAWSGDYDKSIVAFRDALETDPRNKALKTGLAGVLRWSHRYDEAERLYREVLQSDGEHHVALKGLAKTYSMTGDFAGSVALLEKAIRLYPDDAELYKDLGTVFAWQKEFKKAIAELNRAVEIAPGYAEAYRTMGDVYTWMKAHQQAVEAYRKAVGIEPNNIENYLLMAESLRASGRRDLAEEAIKSALKIDPADSHALDLLRNLRQDPGYTILKGLGEATELIAFLLVFIAIFFVSRARKHMLKRKHRAYFYFVNVVLPALVVLTFASFLGRSYFSRWLEVGFIEEFTEAVLFLSLGVSFFALLLGEKRGKEFARTTILAIGAHPDDIELGCGAFVMKAKDSGARVYGLTMTKGEKGSSGNGDRAEELRKAAVFMELDGHWALDMPDTGLNGMVREMKDAVEEKIRETGATMVLTHTPMDLHTDHQAVFEATKVAARNISMLCYEDVSTPREFVPNYFVDVTGYIDDKMRLVGLHRTQEGKNYMDPDVVRGRAAHRGIQCGVQFAEAFRTYKLLR